MREREGNYRCKVIGQDSGESQKKGTPFFMLKIQPQDFLDGEYPSDATHQPPGSIYFWITPKTVEFVMRDLGNLGWSGSDFQSLLRHDFTGAELEATLGENDQGYPEWRLTYRREVIPIDKDKMSKLDRLFAKSAPKQQPKTDVRKEAEAVYAPANNGPTGDEIPF